jgi:hypothetical protein
MTDTLKVASELFIGIYPAFAVIVGIGLGIGLINFIFQGLRSTYYEDERKGHSDHEMTYDAEIREVNEAQAIGNLREGYAIVGDDGELIFADEKEQRVN